MRLKTLLFSAFIVLFLVYSVKSSIAKADNLVIGDDGNVVLVITSTGVLGVTTITSTPQASPPPQSAPQSAPQPKQTDTHVSTPPPPPANPQPQAPVKTVPLVAPHTESTVQINPPINNDKKIQVTITTNTTPQNSPPPVHVAPQTTKPLVSPATAPSSVGSKVNSTQAPTPTSSPKTATSTITKTVDQVVAQGANGQPVLSIKSDKANQLTVQQGTTQVTTSLPLQINTMTHGLSVPTTTNATTPVFVLPTQALQGILSVGTINAKNLENTPIHLTKDASGINYTVTSQKQGKLFGVFPVQSPIQVKLSAQSGKVVTTSQSVLFNIFGGFIK